MRSRPLVRAQLAALSLAFAAPVAHANCGAAVCLINTNWDTQGVWTQPGLRVDLRYEAVRQDDLRRGSHKVDAAEIEEGEAVPLQTREKSWIATFDYAFDSRWGVSLTVPYVRRTHRQLVTSEEDGSTFVQPLRMSEIGDVRVIGRYQVHGDVSAEHGALSAGVNVGVKLPTGKDDVRYSDGSRAEPGLQPGSGTYDAIAGGYLRQTLGPHLGWFAQLQYQSALDRNDGFKPGDKTRLDLGVRYALSDAISLLLQANFLHAAKDKGARAEPENTGGRLLTLSPGVSVFVARDTQVYAFYQRPLHQHLNGVQLSTRDAFGLGISQRF